MQATNRKRWTVFAPPEVLCGSPADSMFALGELPADLETTVETNLQLTVPQRSYRSPSLCRWVDLVLAGETVSAKVAADELQEYPIHRAFTCSGEIVAAEMRTRRASIGSSSWASAAKGRGAWRILHASAGNEIAQWYLEPRDDIRSSYALEVPANEYTCQGLELDFFASVGVAISSGVPRHVDGCSIGFREQIGNVFGKATTSVSC